MSLGSGKFGSDRTTRLQSLDRISILTPDPEKQRKYAALVDRPGVVGTLATFEDDEAAREFLDHLVPSDSEVDYDPLPKYVSPKDERESYGLRVNFFVMTIAFSINHGAAATVLALASSELGEELAGLSVGTLFAAYTIAAVTIAPGLVKRIGPKYGMTLSMFGYCVYVGSTLFAVTYDNRSGRYPAAIAASAVGGLAAGSLWTAQGTFYARTTERLLAAKNTSDNTTAWLAGIFAAVYVGVELVFKLSASLLRLWGGRSFVLSIFTASAGCSAFAMLLFVSDVAPLEIVEDVPTTAWHKLTLASGMLTRNRKMQLISPFCLAFGFCSAFINLYVNGVIVGEALGERNIGYMAAIIPGVASLLSMPFSNLSGLVGKGPVMVVGALCMTGLACAMVGISEAALGRLGWTLSVFYVLMGCGRAVFEGPLKATVADFFYGEAEGAFASIILQFGGASSISFFLFPYLTKDAMAVPVIIFGLLSVVTLPLAFYQFAKESDERAYGEMTGDIN